MGLFSKKALPATIDVTPVEMALSPADRELVSMAELNGIEDAITRSIQKTLSAASYIAFDNIDDQGGFFGTEFEIRTTAGRLKGLYSREPWIFTGGSHIARTLATVPMKVYPKGGDKPLPTHPVQALLDSGSPTQSPMELRIVKNLDLSLGGNYFQLLEKDFKTVAGLAPVELCSLVYNREWSRIEALDVYQVGGGNQAARFPIEQVIHVKLPNPFNFLYGLSPFAAAARPILLDRYKNEFEMAFYLRGATSSGVIETTEDLSKSRYQRLVRTFEQNFTGRANWWRNLFLPKGAKYIKSSLTMAEMQHLEGLKENRKTILAVLGIPPSLVGLIEDVNRATAEQQERIFWQNTIAPSAQLEAAGWNNSHLIKVIHKGKVEVRPDFSGIEAIEGFTSTKKEKADAMAPYFWIDEIRSKVFGAEPAADGTGRKYAAEVKGAGASLVPGELALPPASQKAVILADGFSVICLHFEKACHKLAQDAQKWARTNGYKDAPVDETATHWGIYQDQPDAYDQETVSQIVVEGGVGATIGQKIDREAVKKAYLEVKAVATSSQNRVEAKLSSRLTKAYDTYLGMVLDAAAAALAGNRPAADALRARAADRLKTWQETAVPVLEAAMERGYSMAFSQVKSAAAKREKRARFTSISESDRQAADVIKERTRDGRRRQLERRAIERFSGMDKTRTEYVMQLIEDGEREGRSYEEMSRELRGKYQESYGNQARTIVRTEVLSAVSEGLDWNHQALGQVFSEVRKEWLHQGDGDINPDAREAHADLDGTDVGRDETWEVDGEQLRYPRDPDGGPGNVINCRCTMISVIPDNATSNADAILESAD